MPTHECACPFLPLVFLVQNVILRAWVSMVHLHSLCFPGDPGQGVFDPRQVASAHHCPPHSCFLLYLLGSELLAMFCILGILNPSHGFSAGGASAPSADKDIWVGPPNPHCTISQGVQQGGPQSYLAVVTNPFHGGDLSVWWNVRWYIFQSGISFALWQSLSNQGMV